METTRKRSQSFTCPFPLKVLNPCNSTIANSSLFFSDLEKHRDQIPVFENEDKEMIFYLILGHHVYTKWFQNCLNIKNGLSQDTNESSKHTDGEQT